MAHLVASFTAVITMRVLLTTVCGMSQALAEGTDAVLVATIGLGDEGRGVRICLFLDKERQVCEVCSEGIDL